MCRCRREREGLLSHALFFLRLWWDEREPEELNIGIASEVEENEDHDAGRTLWGCAWVVG